ncbi:Protein CBG25785 [Caenorhabditis briggsae]|uniref:Protein CBG25785 n=1 Tax=Caenorhabditis briggsae TaxID=6238 RepID=B6IGK8_CAEBR|nr:Protein CBG25785 [Caenorhabditis briggsae]CAR99038.1 Protein CBG25785 [Caenorhabditis briggsae]
MDTKSDKKKSRKPHVAPESSNSSQPPQFRLQIGSNQFLTVPQFDQLLDRLAVSEQTAKASLGPQ